VLIPALVVELDEFDPTLGQAAGEEAVGGEGAGRARIFTVKVEDVFGFGGEVVDLGDGGLHPVGHLVLGDAGVDLPVGSALELVLVELAEAVEEIAPALAVDTGWVSEVEDGVFPGTELDAVVAGGQKTAAPETGVEGLAALAFGDEDDEGGQVVVVAAEAVVEPRAYTGAPGHLGARLEEGDRGVVVDGLGVHGSNDAEVVDDFGSVGQELADPGTGFPVLRERILGTGERER